jgi:hypothetical protein
LARLGQKEECMRDHMVMIDDFRRREIQIIFDDVRRFLDDC